MSHGVIDVFAFQEALLVMAVFGAALLTMIWVGFRRWLQHKEKMARVVAEQTGERAAQQDAQMKRVEERLTAIERVLSEGGAEQHQLDALRTSALPNK